MLEISSRNLILGSITENRHKYNFIPLVLAHLKNKIDAIFKNNFL